MSFLPESIRGWRSARAQHRAVAIRNGGIVLSERRKFVLYEAAFASLAAADRAVADGSIPWIRIKALGA